MTSTNDQGASTVPDRVFVRAQALPENMKLVIRDKDEHVDLVCAAFFAEGHVLLLDDPGTGKTIAARALGESVEAVVKRIQFTPDLTPSDITGSPVYNRATMELDDKPGPTRTANVLICDEINRAMSKTQSALLEVMGEGQVTTGGVTHRALTPFFVIATENPLDHEGTNPLPEAQIDRFTIRDTFGHPSKDAMVEIALAQEREHPIDSLGSVMSLEELIEIQEAVRDIHLKRPLLEWIARIVTRTQWLSNPASASEGEQQLLLNGASVRGVLSLQSMTKAWALLQGRQYVLPEDVERMIVPVLGHRIIPNQTTESGRAIADGDPEAITEFFSTHVLRHELYVDEG